MSERIPYDRLAEWTGSILKRGYGYSDEEARLTSRVLVEADARGISSHGVSRLAFYRRDLRGNFCRPGAKPEIVMQTPLSIVVDGHDGVGSLVADWSVRRLIELAEKSGAAFCAVRDSNHYGIAGYWAEEIAKNNMIGMAFTNTINCAIPTYGRQRMLGTNPIAVAIPEGGDRIFMLDMATTTVAHGKVEVCDRRGMPMPLGWAVDERGIGTTDATAFEKLTYSNPKYGGHLFLGGEGEVLGGHKGYGLGLLVELLCSGLSIGVSSADTYREGHNGGITHFFGAVKLDIFGSPDEIKKHVGGILQAIRDSEKAEGQDRIYIHGEKERETRDRSMTDGVMIDDATFSFLKSLSDEFGVDIPSL